MFFFRATRYMRYMLLARHRSGHGIHSPFVFDLVSRIFRNKIDTKVVSNIEEVRKRLIADARLIVVNDLGAGGVKMKPDLRKVSDIARYSSVPKKYGVLLSNMAVEFGEHQVVELGTSFGISAMYLASGCSATIVRTIEGSPAIAEIALKNIEKAGIKNIEVITGSFDEVLPSVLQDDSEPGLVFIDGNHRKKPVMNYFRQIAEKSGNNTVVILDDIYYSEEMEDAWNEIKRFENVSVTIDIFRMGIVFFREGMSHKDYIIRY